MNILSAQFVISNTDVRKCPGTNLPEYAFIGRSNVGKSSLINMLVNRKGLAMTSARPGKTMLINHFLINNEWYIVDLPGYGFARAGKESRGELRKIIENYILHRRQLTNLFVLIDCRHAPQVIDREFLEWLGVHGLPFSVVFTKADKLSNTQLNHHITLYEKCLLEQWNELPPVFVTSSETAKGREELLDYIDLINRQLKFQD